MKDEYSVFAALVELTKADGRISPEERAWLLEILDRAGLGGEELIESPPPLDREALKRELPTHQERRVFLRFLLMVSLADGSATADEMAFISSLAADLGVSQNHLEELRRRTLLASDPEDD